MRPRMMIDTIFRSERMRKGKNTEKRKKETEREREKMREMGQGLCGGHFFLVPFSVAVSRPSYSH